MGLPKSYREHFAWSTSDASLQPLFVSLNISNHKIQTTNLSSSRIFLFKSPLFIQICWAILCLRNSRFIVYLSCSNPFSKASGNHDLRRRGDEIKATIELWGLHQSELRPMLWLTEWFTNIETNDCIIYLCASLFSNTNKNQFSYKFIHLYPSKQWESPSSESLYDLQVIKQPSSKNTSEICHTKCPHYRCGHFGHEIEN